MRSYRTLQAIALCLLSTSCATASSGDLEGTNRGPRRHGKGACYDGDRDSSENPTVCHASEATYVTGLPRNHNWTRGSRVLVTQEDEAVEARIIAIAWVVEAHPKAARINVIIQEPSTSVEGGIAHVPDDQRRLRFKNFYARLERDGGHMLLDIGSNDGVSMHDVYEARDPRRPDLPVGRVQVTQVHEMSAEVALIFESEPLGGQHEFVLSRSPDTSTRPVRIAVLPVQEKVPPPHRPAAPRDKNHDFVLAALRQAQKNPESFEFLLQDLEPERNNEPAALHQRIAQRARAANVDQVIWTTGACVEEPCVLAWHATVPSDPMDALTPEPLLLPSIMGGTAAGDRSAVLGQLAFASEAFDEASYHLRSWAAQQSGTLLPEALLQLAEAEHAVGQLDRARMWLRQIKGLPINHEQLVSYFRARARVACGDANMKELDALHKFAGTHVAKYPGVRLAQLDVLECKIQESLRTGNGEATAAQIEDGLALARQLGDQEAISRLETFKGQLYEHAGEFDKGEQHLQQAREAAVAAGDQGAQAHIGLALAKNRILVGDFAKAQEFARGSLEVYKTLQDEGGIVECLPVLVQIQRRLHGTEAARTFLEAERSALKRRRLPRAELALRLAGVYLELQRGELARAEKQLKQLQGSVRKLGHVDEEVQLLGMAAELYLLTGKTQQAQKTIDHYWRRADELHRGSDQARARLLFAEFRLQEGNSKHARKLAEQASDRYRALGDHAGVAAAELILGEIEREFGDVQAAKQRYQAARSQFDQVQDVDGRWFADLGLATLGLWREGASHVRYQLPGIVSHFKRVGNATGLLRASLQSEWAIFLHARDRAASLQSLKNLRDTARRKQFAAFEAEAQMLIACVYRVDSDHKTADQEFRVARGLYAALGRHTQPWPCDVTSNTLALTSSAVQHGSP